VIVDFADAATERFFRHGVAPPRWRNLATVVARKLDMLDAATSLKDLASPGASLEALKRDRKGQHSIRVNRRWRVCFVWDKDKGGPAAVEVVDYH
jgi:toxin HigB-1